MNTLEAVVQYEKQHDPKSSRTCGAACLSMIYRSFGKIVDQTEIWKTIAKPNRFGSLSSVTHLMVGDALTRGFAAVAIQARHPLQALRICCKSGIRAILNHRLRNDVATGHYSVLIDIDDRNVVLHDPFYGPSRRYSHAELLTLWQPRFPTSEITGNLFIALSDAPPAVAACQLCNNPIPSTVDCPKCKKPVGLQPAATLGCMSRDCIGRLWDNICCPSCDHLWAASLEPVADAGTAIPAKPTTSAPVEDGRKRFAATIDVDKLFGAIDKLYAQIIAIPGAASHPDIRKQLDHITESKEKFKLAYAEQLARSAMFQEQFVALGKKAKEQKEAHRKRMEELNRPSPPPDGDALGRALLKNLGLTNG